MTHNPITGDKIATKLGSDEAKMNFDIGWSRIFGGVLPDDIDLTKEAEKSALVIMEADNVPNSE
jgi:hypothetical protein